MLKWINLFTLFEDQFNIFMCKCELNGYRIQSLFRNGYSSQDPFDLLYTILIEYFTFVY